MKLNKISRILLLSLFYASRIVLIRCDHKTEDVLPITLIYDSDSIDENLTMIAVKNMNERYSQLKLYLRLLKLHKSDSTKLSRIICDKLSENSLLVFGSFSLTSWNFVKSLSEKYKRPYITWGDHENEANLEYMKQIYLRPLIIPALLEFVKSLKIFSELYYIYNDENGKKKLETMLDFKAKNKDYFSKIIVRKIIDTKKCREMLRSIQSSTKQSHKTTIIVDLSTKEDFTVFFAQVMDLSMIQSKFHYIITYPSIHELNLNNFQHGGVRISGFSIVDYNNLNTIKKISELIYTDQPLNKLPFVSFQTALVIDGVMSLIESAKSLKKGSIKQITSNVRIKSCHFGLKNSSSETYKPSQILAELFVLYKNSSYEGLTGNISFDEYGFRKDFEIYLYKIDFKTPLKKIGMYSSKTKSLVGEEVGTEFVNDLNRTPEKKLIVISVIDEPFFMYRQNKSGEVFKGNDRFMGYCVDLTKKIAEIVGFDYEIRPVKDGRFGAKSANGSWDGMVGEILRNEAHLAVGSLTISAQRERAIGFSMPFMNMGISIMIKKPKKEKPGVFSFMAPLDSKIWIYVILAYLAVSVSLFVVCRFSPNEWRYVSQIDEFRNHFSILNTLWFNLAAFMQQGVDFAPRSSSGRFIASAWWFFNLILISSYTANLAAFLTVERMVNPIESAEDLAKQNEIRYGAVEGGSTVEFFKNSKVPTYARMWNNMNSNEWSNTVFVKNNNDGAKLVRESKGKYAFLLESSLNEYLNERYPCNTIKVGDNLDSKGYGIATAIDSEFKESINLAILQLKEEGFLDDLKTRWWYDRSECGNSVKSQAKDSSKGSLNLINVAGIFYILIAGLIVSVVIASLEITYQARIQAKYSNILFTDAIKSRVRQSISGFDE